MNRSRPFTGGRSSLKRQIAWAAMWPNDAKWGCNGHGRFTKLDQYVDFLHLMGPYMLVTWVRIILCRDRKGWMKNKNCIESCWDLNNYPTTQLGVWPCVIHGLNGLTFGLVAGTPKPQVVNSFTLWHEERFFLCFSRGNLRDPRISSWCFAGNGWTIPPSHYRHYLLPSLFQGDAFHWK